MGRMIIQGWLLLRAHLAAGSRQAAEDRNRKKRWLSLLLPSFSLQPSAFSLICALLLLASSALAQNEFGKNKVRYNKVDWKVLKTEHFEVYHDQKTEGLARTAASMAEEAYASISQSLQHQISNPIPFIIFKSHYDFQQTNVITELIDPGVGGFSEVIKFRMVIPFTGSYLQLKKVVTHELTHVFTYDVLYPDGLESMLSVSAVPPMWFMEGLAEYETGVFDPMGHMMLVDAVVENQLIPLEYLTDFGMTGNVFLAYQESHSLLQYIAQTYGQEKASILLRKFKKSAGLEETVKQVIGVDSNTLETGWIKALRQVYYPEVAIRKLAADDSRQIFEQRRILAAPSFSPGGDLAAVTIINDGIPCLALMKLKDGTVVKNITAGMRGIRFDELSYEAGPAYSRDGSRIAFIAKRKARDMIFIWDVFRERLLKKMRLDLDNISSLCFAQDSNTILLTGLKNGKSNIYRCNISTGGLEQITVGMDRQPLTTNHTKYTNQMEQITAGMGRQKSSGEDAASTGLGQITAGMDRQPAYSPVRNAAAFIREQGTATDLYVLDMDSGEEQRLPLPAVDKIDPFWSPDGSIVYCSCLVNRVYNIWAVNVGDAGTGLVPVLEAQKQETVSSRHCGSQTTAPVPAAGEMSQVTNYFGGAFNGRYIGDRLSFMSYTKGGNAVYFQEKPLKIVWMQPETGSSSQVSAVRGQGTEIAGTLPAASCQLPTADYRSVVKGQGTETAGTLSAASCQLPTTDYRSVVKGQGTETAGTLPAASCQLPTTDYRSVVRGQGTETAGGNTPATGDITPYKTRITFDWRRMDMMYSSVNGFAGVGELAMSDILGNHRFIWRGDASSSIAGDANFVLAYLYLGKRASYEVDIFDWTNSYRFQDEEFKEKRYGVSGNVSYPIDIFRRVEFGITNRRIATEYTLPKPDTEREDVNLVSSEVIHDTTVWSWDGPVGGSRAMIGVSDTVKLSDNDLDFTNLEMDLRKYIKTGNRSVLALQLTGKTSNGRDQTQFILDDGSMLVVNENGRIKRYSVYEFRGGTGLKGKAFAKGSFEFRFPLIDTIQFALPVSIKNIRSLIFFDIAAAWRDGKPPVYRRMDAENPIRGAFGWGIRANLWIFPIRIDYAWGTDFISPTKESVKHFSLGYDF